MTPFYFGMRQRRLFGIYEPARTSSAHAAVLCNPWGNEYIHAYRSLRQLALLLTIAGFHILRFDYYGTGNSAGDMIDADVQGWKADIETAMDELRHITDLQQVTLVGLRLGATLAAAVAADPSVEPLSMTMTSHRKEQTWYPALSIWPNWAWFEDRKRSGPLRQYHDQPRPAVAMRLPAFRSHCRCRANLLPWTWLLLCRLCLSAR